MIKQKPSQISNNPGVYFFKDSGGKILYIGKAANLKKRLASYFSKSKKDPRIQKMLKEAARVDWQETDSEIEAFLTEAELIKEHRPGYNIALRDDKRYSYVIISDDAFPKIYVTHQPEPILEDSTATVFGPFVESGTLRATLGILRRLFPYCNCRRPHNNYCLNYHLGRCLGFCCLNPSADGPTITDGKYQEYKDNIKAIKEILGGRKNNLVTALEKEMELAGKNEDFESAIGLRNKLEKIKKVLNNARVIKEIAAKGDVLVQIKRVFGLANAPQRIEGYDISNIQGKFGTGSMVVFIDGNPDKNEYRKFRIRFGQTPNDTQMLKEVLIRRLKHPEWQYPDLILIDGGKGQINAALTAIKTSELNIPIVSLTKDEHHLAKHVYLNQRRKPIPLKRLSEGVRNLFIQIDSEAHRFAIQYYRKIHRRLLAG